MPTLKAEEYNAVDLVRQKFPFIEDPRAVFKPLDHEGIRIEGVLVNLGKHTCARCGGPRHALDCKGFCRDCKILMGIPVNKKPERNLDAPRGAAPLTRVDPKNESFLRTFVDDELIHDLWDLVPLDARRAIMETMWSDLSKEKRVHALKQALKYLKETPSIRIHAGNVDTGDFTVRSVPSSVSMASGGFSAPVQLSPRE